ncbi:MAG: hypothetical protein JAY90_18675 [Candidatus Thiodiazotropha lotti]|nr:hypothetical protein [Candidatus Thiodiazotropha lotti]
MRKNKLNVLEKAHIDMSDWAEWMIKKIEKNSIGYPNHSTEGRLIKNGGVTSESNHQACHPDLSMTPSVSVVDYAIKNMPKELRKAVYCKYIPDCVVMEHYPEEYSSGQWRECDKVELFCLHTGKSKSDYYRYWDIVRAFVAGCTSRNEK